MTNVVAFKPRPRPAEPAPLPLAGIDLRTHLEDAAQTALDAAEKIMTALDHIDSGDGATAPLAAAIAGHVDAAADEEFRYRTAAGEGFRYRNTRGCARVREEEPVPEPSTDGDAASDPEPESPTVAMKTAAEPEIPAEPIRLPWRGAGNVVSAAGCAILALVGAA